jgi:hypothetical protein
MEDGKIYPKEEVVSYMASQGLVYSGLEEHFDDWFEYYCSDYGFEDIGNDNFIYHEEDW